MMVLIADDDSDWTDAANRWMQESADTAEVNTRIYPEPSAMIAAIEDEDEIPAGTVIFLDLDFSSTAINGLDTLKRMKEHEKERIRNLPVIIYSRSDSDGEISQSYANKANSFVSKGRGRNQRIIFLDTVRFWMKTAKLPS